MSAVDELIAKVNELDIFIPAPFSDRWCVPIDDVLRLIREAFAVGGPCLTREQAVEVCERKRDVAVADVSREHPGEEGYDCCGVSRLTRIRDAFRSGEEPR